MCQSPLDSHAATAYHALAGAASATPADPSSGTAAAAPTVVTATAAFLMPVWLSARCLPLYVYDRAKSGEYKISTSRRRRGELSGSGRRSSPAVSPRLHP